MSIETLKVLLNNREIGALIQLTGDRSLFEFNESYIEDRNRPILSLSFKDIYGGLITHSPVFQTRLPPFFSNLLPEGALREYITNQLGIKTQREFLLLKALGEDLPGAIQILPADLTNLPSIPFETLTNDSTTTTSSTFHFSLAGIQLKFSAVKKNTKGLTIPLKGVGGSWIIKLPHGIYQGVPENEFAMMALAKAVGITTEENTLIPLEAIEGLPSLFFLPQSKAFAIQRFDRSFEKGKIHIEDFAQILNVYPEKKYEKANYGTLADIIWKETGEQGLTEFIRRLVFTILIGNGDMHLKNWSLRYPLDQEPELTPAYDFISTIQYIPQDKLALNLSGEKAFSAIEKKSFLKLTEKAHLPEKLVMETVEETLEKFQEQWKQRSQFNIPKPLEETLCKHLKGLALL